MSLLVEEPNSSPGATAVQHQQPLRSYASVARPTTSVALAFLAGIRADTPRKRLREGGDDGRGLRQAGQPVVLRADDLTADD